MNIRTYISINKNKTEVFIKPYYYLNPPPNLLNDQVDWFEFNF